MLQFYSKVIFKVMRLGHNLLELDEGDVSALVDVGLVQHAVHNLAQLLQLDLDQDIRCSSQSRRY